MRYHNLLNTFLFSLVLIWCSLTDCNVIDYEIIEIELLKDLNFVKLDLGFIHMYQEASLDEIDIKLKCPGTNSEYSSSLYWIDAPEISGMEFAPSKLPLHLTAVKEELLLHDNKADINLNYILSLVSDENISYTSGIFLLLACSYNGVDCNIGSRELMKKCVLYSNNIFYDLNPKDELYSKITLKFPSDIRKKTLINMLGVEEKILNHGNRKDPCSEETTLFSNCVKEYQDIRKCEDEEQMYMKCKKNTVLESESEGNFSNQRRFTETQSKVCSGSSTTNKDGNCPSGNLIPPGLGIPEINGPVPPLPFGPDLGPIGGMIIGAIIQGVIGPAIVEKTQQFTQIAAKVLPPILNKSLVFGMTPPVDLSMLEPMALEMKNMLEMAKAQAAVLTVNLKAQLIELKEQFEFLKLQLLEKIQQIQELYKSLQAQTAELMSLAQSMANEARDAAQVMVNLAMDKLELAKSAFKNAKNINLKFPNDIPTLPNDIPTPPNDDDAYTKEMKSIEKSIILDRLQSDMRKKEKELGKVVRESETTIQNKITDATEPIQIQIKDTVSSITAAVNEAEAIVKQADGLMQTLSSIGIKDNFRSPNNNTTRTIEDSIGTSSTNTTLNATLIDHILSTSVQEVMSTDGDSMYPTTYTDAAEELYPASEVARNILHYGDRKHDSGKYVYLNHQSTNSTNNSSNITSSAPSLHNLSPLVSVNASISASSTINAASPSVWGWNSGEQTNANITLSWMQSHPDGVTIKNFKMRALHDSSGTHHVTITMIDSNNNSSNITRTQSIDFNPSDGFVLTHVFTSPLRNVSSFTVHTQSVEPSEINGGIECIGWKYIEIWSKLPSLVQPDLELIQLKQSQMTMIVDGKKKKRKKKSDYGALVQILVSDLSHDLTTLFTKVITEDISDRLVPELKNSLGGLVEEPLTSFLTSKLSELLSKALPIALDTTIVDTLKVKLPERLRPKLVKSIATSMTRSLTHAIPPSLFYTLKSDEIEKANNNSNLRFRNNNNNIENQTNMWRQMTANDYYASYYSDYYTEMYIGASDGQQNTT